MCCQILLWYGQSIEKGHFGLRIIHEKIATCTLQWRYFSEFSFFGQKYFQNWHSLISIVVIRGTLHKESWLKDFLKENFSAVCLVSSPRILLLCQLLLLLSSFLYRFLLWFSVASGIRGHWWTVPCTPPRQKSENIQKCLFSAQPLFSWKHQYSQKMVGHFVLFYVLEDKMHLWKKSLKKNGGGGGKQIWHFLHANKLPHECALSHKKIW